MPSKAQYYGAFVAFGGEMSQTAYITPKRREGLAATLRELTQKQEARRAEKEAKERARPRADLGPVFDLSWKMIQLEKIGADEVLRHPEMQTSAAFKAFVEWLIKESRPDDRHVILSGINTDTGLDASLWMIRQPDTDIASVLTAFWRSEPSFYIREIAQGRVPPRQLGESDFDLLVEVKSRVDAGFYRPKAGHAPIAFELPQRITWDRSDPAFAQAEALLVQERRWSRSKAARQTASTARCQNTFGTA